MPLQTFSVKLQPIKKQQLMITIKGDTPLIQHKWSEKALTQIREKGAGRKTRNREVRNPEQEFKAATYVKETGEYALPVTALKAAIISAAHKDIGIEKTLVRKALFIQCDDDKLLPMKCDEPVMREDFVRVGQGAADLRYRPEFKNWGLTCYIEYDADLLRDEDIVNLFNRAGFGVGVGEWRPEKDGDNGRFSVLSV